MPFGRAPKRIAGSAFRSEIDCGHWPGASLAGGGGAGTWEKAGAARASATARIGPARRKRVIKEAWVGNMSARTIAAPHGGGKAPKRRAEVGGWSRAPMRPKWETMQILKFEAPAKG